MKFSSNAYLKKKKKSNNEATMTTNKTLSFLRTKLNETYFEVKL